MSASPVPIPTKRVYIEDPSELPSCYSSTPGGTLYSTTPGGTKIVYDRSSLMNLRNSPISKTPPTYQIPDCLVKGKKFENNKRHVNSSIRTTSTRNPPNNPCKVEDQEEQFQLEL